MGTFNNADAGTPPQAHGLRTSEGWVGAWFVLEAPRGIVMCSQGWDSSCRRWCTYCTWMARSQLPNGRPQMADARQHAGRSPRPGQRPAWRIRPAQFASENDFSREARTRTAQPPPSDAPISQIGNLRVGHRKLRDHSPCSDGRRISNTPWVGRGHPFVHSKPDHQDLKKKKSGREMSGFCTSLFGGGKKKSNEGPRVFKAVNVEKK